MHSLHVGTLKLSTSLPKKLIMAAYEYAPGTPWYTTLQFFLLISSIASYGSLKVCPIFSSNIYWFFLELAIICANRSSIACTLSGFLTSFFTDSNLAFSLAGSRTFFPVSILYSATSVVSFILSSNSSTSWLSILSILFRISLRSNIYFSSLKRCIVLIVSHF